MVPPSSRSRGALLVLLLFVLLLANASVGAPVAAAQPAAFGSADDPREPGTRAPWQAERYAGLWAGPSLLGPQWRAGATGVLAYIGPTYAARLEGYLRGGVYGTYEEDTDELYDLVRLLDFARYTRRTDAVTLYGRAGTIQQMRLGPAGHLVEFFRTDTAFDERTVGLELFARSRRYALGLFTADVRLNELTGGRLSARPFAPAEGSSGDPSPLSSAEVGLTAVTDLGLVDALGGGAFASSPLADSLRAPTALAIDARYDATAFGGIALSPFASIATLLDAGWGLGGGAALATDNFADLARLALRLGLFYSSDDFVPGTFGPLYQVNNARAGIARSGSASDLAPGERSSTVSLSEIDAALGWSLGLRLLFFERFELTSSYYGHLGDQDLSRYHLRLFFQTQAGTRLFVRLDHTGLDNVFSILSEADDQTAVTFNADYRLPFSIGPAGVWAHLRTRYTFERLADDVPGIERYIPERRFEPSVGLRLAL